MRIENHIVLGDLPEAPVVEITFDGKPIKAREGEPILAALLSEGVIISRYSVKYDEPRGLFCGIGQCTDCAMIVNGQANVRTCIEPVANGQVIETQYGVGGKAK
jgi:predicted molibdopterin-dependent oxidoreductase YjgC